MATPQCCMDVMNAAAPGQRTFWLLNHMINSGELTVGEARAELASPLLDADSAALLAGWVLDRADQGDDWRAGDPVRRANGIVTAYVDECVDPRHLVADGDETYSVD